MKDGDALVLTLEEDPLDARGGKSTRSLVYRMTLNGSNDVTLVFRVTAWKKES